MDLFTILGIAVGVGAVVGGMVLEGGTLDSITQLTAAIIVFGGTLGAVLVNHSLSNFVRAIKNLKKALAGPSGGQLEVISLISELSGVARKEGLLAIENRIKGISNPFLRKGLQLVVDGTEPRLTREILEIDMAYAEEYDAASAKVFESAGGYAPTIGILGAVLGLIHVMENLAEPEKLGAGIAVAFVATVYGVGSANLFWLPLAGKIKHRVREEMILNEMIVEGLVSLSEGENPRRLTEKLSGFLKQGLKKDAMAA